MKFINTLILALAHNRAYMYAPAYAHPCVNTNIFTNAHNRTCTCVRKYIHTHTRLHMGTHSLTYWRIHIHAVTFINPHSCPHACAHSLVNARALYMHTYAPKLTFTHTHTHTSMHTIHLHIHTYFNIWAYMPTNILVNT